MTQNIDNNKDDIAEKLGFEEIEGLESLIIESNTLWDKYKTSLNDQSNFNLSVSKNNFTSKINNNKNSK